ncbi:MAG: Mur ligase family protein [Fimbriimonadaceae bacterium]|nr:Mur ligase family protein [Fimbriimonadaceae bacterium]
MKSLYFIRVGGTAMGSVAAAIRELGIRVSGSETDLYEPMKSYLAAQGVTVYPEFSESNLEISDPDWVVVGNAVSRGNIDLEAALLQRRRLISLPDLVQQTLIGSHTSVVIAGTHGKTTTTAMAAWLLEVGSKSPGFLVGGVPENFSVSCRPVPEPLRGSREGIFVIEGDEYDSAYFDKRSKFLHYRPDVAVVNNIEFDHQDIFENLEAVLKQFRLFVRLVPGDGLVLANGDDPNVKEVLKVPCSPVQTFGFGSDNDWVVSDVVSDTEGTSFNLLVEGIPLRLSMSLFGRHNVLNMAVAAIVALRAGVDRDQVVHGASTFVPPKRRMEEIGTWQGALVVDDFGHHPTAIRETLGALSQKYFGRRLVVAFEPRSNTTTRATFQQELSECFEEASCVAIGALDRPYRYSREERLDPDQLVRSLEARDKKAWAIETLEQMPTDWGLQVADVLRTWLVPGDVLVTFSNGDFGGLRRLIRQEISQEKGLSAAPEE